MKKLTTLFLVAISSVMLAQIPNPCLGSWTGGVFTTPASWQSSNIIVHGSVSQSGTVHGSCANAAALNSVDTGSGIYYGGSLVTWSGHTAYFANAGNPVALNGWYELNSVSGDELTIAVGTKCHSNHINGGGLNSYNVTSGSYKQFSVCITVDSSTVDSVAIYFNLNNSRGHDTTHALSLATIDDLSFGTCGISGVEPIGNNVTLESVYPNPASTTCNIIFSIPATSSVNAVLYDLSGRKVMNILANTTMTDGRYKIPVDVTKLANGVYAYTITVDGVPYTQKLVVAK
jgi:hypothetical protein